MMGDDDDNVQRERQRRKRRRIARLRSPEAVRERPAGDAERPPHLELPPCREGPGFRVFEILPKTTFTWSNVAGGGRLSYDLCPYVPLVGTPEAVLAVRVHDNGMVTGQRAELVLQLVSLSDEDPQTIFVWAQELARVVVEASTQEGICATARLRADLGTHLRAILDLDQATSPTAASVTLSAELLGRTAADGEACTCSPA